jgi:hypothetical protein
MAEPGASEPAPGQAVERRLVFDLASKTYALRLTEVSGVVAMGPLRRVPMAPAGVLGLAEWRGRLLTVLDLPGLLDERHGKGSPSLVRLAPPFDHLALFVPAGLRVEEVGIGWQEGDTFAVTEVVCVLEPKELAEALAGKALDRGTRQASPERRDPSLSRS